MSLPHKKSARRRPLSLDDITIVDRQLVHRSVGATALGNAMEWFDFGVFSYIAVTLGKVFFPSSSPGAQLIATFATFAAAFVVRPLGGAVFGPLGDRIGRQRVLALTMIMMALGTFAIGLIPGYDRIGIAAPLLLLVARLVQGFSTGGEYGGAATFVAEFAPDRRRGFLGSFLEFGTLTGYILGSAVVTLLSMALGEARMLTWGWRVPFLIAGPLGLVGLYMRLKLEETPAFKKQADASEAQREKPRMAEMLRKQLRPMLQCIGLVLVFNVADYMLLSYMPSYLSSTLSYDAAHGLLQILLVMIVMMPLTLLAGRLSDRIGRRPVILAGCAGLLLAYPALMLVRTGSTPLIFAGLMIMGVALSCFTGAMPSALPALFPTPVRFGALAIGFNVSVSLFGGTTPLAAAWLVEKTGNAWMPAFYLMVAGVIGAIAAWSTPETARRPLKGSGPAVDSHAHAREIVAASEAAHRAATEGAAAAEAASSSSVPGKPAH